MQLQIKDNSLETLLELYNQEMALLNEKLLNGESWENLKNHRRNITELAVLLHKSHGYIVSNRASGNSTEFPQIENVSDGPLQDV